MFVTLLFVTIASAQTIYENCEIYGNCQPAGPWLTESLGILIDVNGTQFFSDEGVLNILESYIDSFWCRLINCTMEGDIDMDGNGINNLGSLSLTQDINLIDKNWLVPTPTLPNHTTNKEYVDAATSSTAFDFFFNNDSSDISGHFNMTESDLERSESTLDSTALGTGTFSIFNWTTLVGQPEFNELRQGVYDVHIHLNSDGPGKKPVTITPKLYNISEDGLSRDLLLTFETSDLLLSVGIEFDLHGVLVEPIMLADGARLNLELEAEVAAGGGDVTVTMTMEGTTDSHLSVETSSNAFEKIFIRRDGTNTLVGDWQVDSVENPFNINMFGNMTTSSNVFISDTTQTNYTKIHHNGSNTVIENNAGGILLSPTNLVLLIKGFIVPTLDNTYDIGVSGSKRFRNIFLTGVVSSNSVTTNNINVIQDVTIGRNLAVIKNLTVNEKTFLNGNVQITPNSSNPTITESVFMYTFNPFFKAVMSFPLASFGTNIKLQEGGLYLTSEFQDMAQLFFANTGNSINWILEYTNSTDRFSLMTTSTNNTFHMDNIDLNVTGDIYVERLILGQHNDSVNSSLQISLGDILGDNAYFNVYSGRSPVTFCDDDWCSITFTKHQKTLWLQKDTNWTILDIIYDGQHYTKQTFWDLVQGTQYEELSLRLNDKIIKLQEDYQGDLLINDCEDAGYKWDGECFEIIKNIVTYEDAVEIVSRNVTEFIESSCIVLDDELREVEGFCKNRVNTGEIVEEYKIKDGCDWRNEEYYCNVRELR